MFLNVESRMDIEELTAAGWKILNPDVVSDLKCYKNFILNSGAEFSVAKETYVKSRSGWFSCRSACYLAASKPVIAQDTGWQEIIEAGKGLFTFDSIKSAQEAINEISSNYVLHSKAAGEIAREYFDSNVVLTKMLEELN
jgi:hypothetical protein